MSTINSTEASAAFSDILQAEIPALGNGLTSLANLEHKYLKDLRINLGNALSYASLTKKESLLLAIASAINEKRSDYADLFEKLAKVEGATEAEIAEAIAAVSLMNVNNIFYRFKHFTNKEYYNNSPAGIKMSLMINPVLGKEFFELLCLAISALNGCEMCVNAHEDSVLKHGGSQARIFDAVRLSAILKGYLILA